MRIQEKIKEVRGSKGAASILENAQKLKCLDKHVHEFLKLVEQDAKENNLKDISKHSKQFEKELHKEIESLIRMTKEDMKLYKRILESIKHYKEKMRQIMNVSDPVEAVASYEMRYANTLLEGANDKLDELNELFRNLKKVT